MFSKKKTKKISNKNKKYKILSCIIFVVLVIYIIISASASAEADIYTDDIKYGLFKNISSLGYDSTGIHCAYVPKEYNMHYAYANNNYSYTLSNNYLIVGSSKYQDVAENANNHYATLAINAQWFGKLGSASDISTELKNGTSTADYDFCFTGESEEANKNESTSNVIRYVKKGYAENKNCVMDLNDLKDSKWDKIDDGTKNGQPVAASLVIQVYKDGKSLVETDSDLDNMLKTNFNSNQNSFDSIINGKHPRTWIAQDTMGDYWIFVAEGRVDDNSDYCVGDSTCLLGLTASEMIDFTKKYLSRSFSGRGNLIGKSRELNNLWNFDGGGSSQMVYQGDVKTPIMENASTHRTTRGIIYWRVKDSEISYDLNSVNDDVISDSRQFYSIDTPDFILSNPTREGYTFEGWTGSNGTTAQTKVSIVKGTTGSKAYKANWSKTMDSLIITLSENSYTYTGSAIKPVVTVKDGSVTLEENVDYTISYSNNTNAGTALITLTGKSVENSSTKSIYTGSVNKTFTISRKGISLPNCSSKIYNKSEQILFEAHTNGEYTNSALKATDAGTYTVSLTPTENYMWKTDNTTTAKNVSCVINKYDLNDATVSTISDHTYDKNVYKPTPSVTVALPNSTSKYTLTDSEIEYEYSTVNPSDVGEYTVTMSAKKDTETFVNNYTGSISRKYNITQAEGYVNLSDSGLSDIAYGTISKTFSVTSSHGGDLSASVTSVKKNGSNITNNVSANVFNSIVTVSNLETLDSGTIVIITVKSIATINYKEATNTYTITITDAKITGGSVEITGNNVVDDTLTAEITNTLPSATYNCTWYANSSDSTSNGVKLSGPSASVNNKCEYTLTSNEVGKYIYVVVEASKTSYSSITFNNKTTINANKTATVKTKVEKPTATTYCINLIYDGTNKTLTKEAPKGYVFSNNKASSAGIYTISSKLNTNYIWDDYSTNDVLFDCSIYKKTISLTAGSSTRPYNGEELTNSNCVANDLVSGHVVTCTMKNTSAIIEIGDVDNEIDNYVIKSESVDVTDNYDVTTIKGKLHVTQLDDSEEDIIEVIDNTYTDLSDNILYLDISNTTGITKKELMCNLTIKSSTIKVLDKNKSEITDENELLTTGSQIKLSNLENNIVVLGDVSSNGKIDMFDVLKTYNHYKNVNNNTGKKIDNEFELRAADYDRNNKIDLSDISSIYKAQKREMKYEE